MTAPMAGVPGVAGQTVTVSRPAGVNRYGDPLPATEHTLTGCVVAPAGSDERTDRADQLTARGHVYAFPADADVTAIDRLTLADGTRWQVSGEPQRYLSPFVAGAAGPAVSVCVITIERVTG